MSLQSRALAALWEDTCSNLRSYTVAHKHLYLYSQSIQHTFLVSWAPDMHNVHRHISRQNDYTKKMIKIKKRRIKLDFQKFGVNSGTLPNLYKNSWDSSHHKKSCVAAQCSWENILFKRLQVSAGHPLNHDSSLWFFSDHSHPLSLSSHVLPITGSTWLQIKSPRTKAWPVRLNIITRH